MPEMSMASVISAPEEFEVREIALPDSIPDDAAILKIATHTYPLARAKEAIEAVAGIGVEDAIHVSILPTFD